MIISLTLLLGFINAVLFMHASYMHHRKTTCLLTKDDAKIILHLLHFHMKVGMISTREKSYGKTEVIGLWKPHLAHRYVSSLYINIGSALLWATI